MTETRSTLGLLLEFLEVPWAEEVLEFHRGRSGVGMNGTEKPIHTAALGRWREDLVDADRETVRRITGGLLDELGYTERCPW